MKEDWTSSKSYLIGESLDVNSVASTSLQASPLVGIAHNNNFTTTDDGDFDWHTNNSTEVTSFVSGPGPYSGKLLRIGSDSSSIYWYLGSSSPTRITATSSTKVIISFSSYFCLTFFKIMGHEIASGKIIIVSVKGQNVYCYQNIDLLSSCTLSFKQKSTHKLKSPNRDYIIR